MYTSIKNTNERPHSLFMYLILCAFTAFALSLTGCDSDIENAAEDAGEAIEDTAEDAADAAEDAIE